MSTAYEPLAVVFARHAKPHVLGTAAIPDLEKRLEVLFATASEAMPGVALPIESFVAFVAARVPAAETPEGALDAVAPHAGDLYLAAALLAGDPRAIRRFEEDFLSVVPKYVGHFGQDATFLSEVTQLLRERMLMGQGEGTTRVADYEGRGPLGGLLRVAAVRAALDLMRRGPKPSGDVASDDAAIELASPSADPETEYIKQHHTQAFREAFTAALSELKREERTLLRMHHLDGLSIDELGTMLRAHRSTVARQIARARQRVLEKTHILLMANLHMDASELASFMDDVRSRFQLSLQQFMTQKEEL